MQMAAQSSPALQVVFTVCATAETTAAVAEAIALVTGTDFLGEFQEYITAERRPQFAESITDGAGAVALVDCDRDRGLALQTMERLHQLFTGRMSIIAVSSKRDADFLLAAMRAGCNDFIDKPFLAKDLAAVLQRLQSVRPSDAQSGQGRGLVYSFYSVKGGAGATTLAVHLSNHLARKHRKKVLLIDHHHELGHVALYLGIKESVYHFDDLTRNVDKLDKDLLEGFVTHHASGIDVLASPDGCAQLQESSTDVIERVLRQLKQCYDFVLIDSSMQNRQAVPAVFAVSDEVYLVTTPDVAAVRDLARHIEHVSLLHGCTSKLRVVVNRCNSDDAVNSEQIEAAVRFPVTAAVPNNFAELLRAINAGEPVSIQQRGGFTQALARWANRLTVDTPFVSATAAPKGRLAFWR